MTKDVIDFPTYADWQEGGPTFGPIYLVAYQNDSFADNMPIGHRTLHLQLTASNHEQIFRLHTQETIQIDINKKPMHPDHKRFQNGWRSLVDVVRHHIELDGPVVRNGTIAIPKDLPPFNGVFEFATYDKEQGAWWDHTVTDQPIWAPREDSDQ